MSARTLTMTPALLEYLRAHSVRPDPLLEALRKETAELEWGRMQISPEQGQLMELLVHLIGARRAIEVGTFTGYSALVTARGMGPEGRLIACDIDPDTTAMARRYWGRAGVADRIDLRLAPALETLDGLLAEGRAGTVDFVFLDADKENYCAYYERCLELLRPGGLLAADNVLWSGLVLEADPADASTRGLQAFNQRVAADPRVLPAMLPIGDGLTLVVKR